MSSSNIDDNNLTPLPEQVDSLLPPFTAQQYSHLPTPQSPNTLGRYLNERPHSPETPVPHGTYIVPPSIPSDRLRNGTRRLDSEASSMRIPSTSQQYVTPESSPHFEHSTSLVNSSAPRHLFYPTSTDFLTPKQSYIDKLESPAPISSSSTTESRSPLPSSLVTSRSAHSSALSSPFTGRQSSEVRRPLPLPTETDDVFSSSKSCAVPITGSSTISTPPISPPRDPGPSVVLPAGGEMERIRQAVLEERQNHVQEAEKRRPDYLKRSKRTLSETEPTYLAEDPQDRERWLSVGVMDSPQKGRRLKLFQETSDESFEESLMAGGYGRYRTADWVRQPQPISLPQTVAGSSIVVSLLEVVEEAPLTEKEAKKRKRLAAFQSDSQSTNNKLCPVELEGKGRVLLDTPAGEQTAPGSPEPSPGKKKATSRKKRKPGEGSFDKRSSGAFSGDDQVEKPNWPDAEFPWRLRTEERIEDAKAEAEERFRWIERYLDRDSDDEEGDEQTIMQGEQVDFATPRDSGSSGFHQVKMGRGKMIPLSVAPADTWNLIPKRPFPVDPADARAALLSKKTVRTLSYRQQKRQRGDDGREENDEALCVCNGKDDGRELVQCDACQTWYHLQCIGIESISELGREEDPWFCEGCIPRARSPSTEPEEVSTSEPTFVPTDSLLSSGRRPSDAPFFQTNLQESPHWSSSKMPRTPTRASNNFLDMPRPSWSWVDSSRPAPSTPHQPLSPPRIYSTPGHLDGHNPTYPDESPFDPTSTPSRGIKFHVPFATPKNAAWQPRSNALFQTPSRAGGRGGANRIHATYSVAMDDNNVGATIQYPFARIMASDESPIRRNRSSDGAIGRRRLHSPP